MKKWKQQWMQRLMKPADGEGSDLGGGGATAAAIEAMGTAPDSQAQELPIESPADAQAQPEAQPTESVAEQPARGKSKMEAMLDALTDDPNTSAKPAAEPVNKVEPVKATDQPKAPEQEVAELLDGVKSERGRERIKQAFAEKKQLEQEIGSFREMVRSTGMSPQQFAQTLEFGRLVSSGDEKNIRMALEMIEDQRAMLYQKLGVEAPGVDLLQGHDDLKKAVDNMEITRERAVELAKYRKQQQEVQQRQQVQQHRYGGVVGEVGHQCPRSAWHFLDPRGVAGDHFDRCRAGVLRHRPRQPPCQHRVQFDGGDLCLLLEQGQGQAAQSGTNLQHVHAGLDAGQADDPHDRVWIDDEVLAQSLRRAQAQLGRK